MTTTRSAPQPVGSRGDRRLESPAGAGPAALPVVQVGIRSFLTAEGNDWGTLMAASSIACIPVVLLYALLHRHVIDGFVRSGLT